MALDPFGEGVIPQVKGRDIFEGSQTHSEHFPGDGYDAMKLMIEFLRTQQNVAREYDKKMLNGLEAAGLKLWDGPSGAGYIELALTRGGVFVFDSDFTSLVSDGAIKFTMETEIGRLKLGSP
ncbi:hypothetical protein ACEPAG_7700 [Sanghuangporus baumii]